MVIAPEVSRSTRQLALLHAMRPKQWVKNILVAAAPLAAGVIDEGPVIVNTAAAIACFEVARRRA